MGKVVNEFRLSHGLSGISTDDRTRRSVRQERETKRPELSQATGEAQ